MAKSCRPEVAFWRRLGKVGRRTPGNDYRLLEGFLEGQMGNLSIKLEASRVREAVEVGGRVLRRHTTSNTGVLNQNLQKGLLIPAEEAQVRPVGGTSGLGGLGPCLQVVEGVLLLVLLPDC